MTEDDCRFLTEYFGKCWHEWQNRLCDPLRKIETYPECKKCGLMPKFCGGTDNRTFDTWQDFGWLWTQIQNRTWWALFVAHHGWDGRILPSLIDKDHFPQLVVKFLREKGRYETGNRPDS